MQETLDERRKENVVHERDFFSKKKNKKRIKQTTGLSVRKKKMLGLNGRECKKKKKKILPGNFCEREW